MRVLDRLLTIVVTATLTSAGWIVFGGTFMQRAGSFTAPSPAVPANGTAVAPSTTSAPLDTGGHAMPTGSELTGLQIPVQGVRGTSLADTFTDKRAGGARLHEALDIMAPEGTAVLAAAPGTVEKLFVSGAGGNTVYVRSADGQTIYYYAHLAAYAPGLAEGQKITAGQVLGSVGYTGNASPDAPHLHFAIMRTTRDAEWWEPATPINPYNLLARK